LDSNPPTKKRKKSSAMLKVIKPATVNQEKIFSAFDDEKHIFVHGCAGTGKTFVGMYLALDAILNHCDYQKLIIVRSTVPSRSQGFLPGNEREKNEIFELPYDALCTKLFDDLPRSSTSNKYKDLKNNGTIEFVSTSYLRGLTWEDSVILVDEVQNMNDEEIHTVITRVGDNCQLMICGDSDQNDLMYLREESCIETLPLIIDKMPSFETIQMTTADNQRNSLVGEWIDARRTITLPEPWFKRKK
jgi:phosphate starvation-inducible protein PhoH and related proteins